MSGTKEGARKVWAGLTPEERAAKLAPARRARERNKALAMQRWEAPRRPTEKQLAQLARARAARSPEEKKLSGKKGSDIWKSKRTPEEQRKHVRHVRMMRTFRDRGWLVDVND